MNERSEGGIRWKEAMTKMMRESERGRVKIAGRNDRGTIVVIKRVEGRVALVSHPPSAPLHSIHHSVLAAGVEPLAEGTLLEPAGTSPWAWAAISSVQCPCRAWRLQSLSGSTVLLHPCRLAANWKGFFWGSSGAKRRQNGTAVHCVHLTCAMHRLDCLPCLGPVLQ